MMPEAIIGLNKNKLMSRKIPNPGLFAKSIEIKTRDQIAITELFSNGPATCRLELSISVNYRPLKVAALSYGRRAKNLAAESKSSRCYKHWKVT